MPMISRRPPPARARLGYLAGALAAGALAAWALLFSLAGAAPAPVWAAGPAAGSAATSLAVALQARADPACQQAFPGVPNLVCNGLLVTYTVIVTNTGDTGLTNVNVLNAIPVDALQKLALLDPTERGTYACTPACTVDQLTQTVFSPIDDDTVVTVTTQLLWALGALGPNEARTLVFAGVVAGQSNGTAITSRATAISQEGAAGVRTVVNGVRVLPLTPGAPSLAASPTWLSDDLGGTFSQDWGDFDRSGQQSLALGSWNGVSVYRYNGQRLEQMAVQSPLGPDNKPAPAFGVRWANVISNAQPQLELVMVGYKGLVSPTVQTISGEIQVQERSLISPTNYILRYDTATDSFVQAAAFTSEYQLVRVVAADFDYTGSAPGLMDLVVSTNQINVDCPVSLLRNTGSDIEPFRWDNRKCLSDSATAALGAGDVDGDGRPDLALGRFPNVVGVIRNTAGAFTATSPGPVTLALTLEASLPYLPYDFAFSDFDRDGRLDLAAAYPLQREARLYRNLGGGQLAAYRTLHTDTFLTPLALDWADFDGDGAPDLAVADSTPRVYLNQRGTFTQTLLVKGLPSQSQLWSVRALRPLAAGGLELALTNRDGPSLLYSAFTPHLSPTLTAAGPAPAASVAWGDFNADNRLDLAFGPAAGRAGQTLLYRNAGDGNLALATAPTQASDNGPVQVSFADVTGDGRLELARGTLAENAVCQLQNQGQNVGLINCWQNAEPPFINHILGWGDVNADGALDVLVGSQGGALLLFRNRGGGLGLAETPALTLTHAAGAVRAIMWADWELTHYPGFAVAFADGGVEVYRNLRDGTFDLAWQATLTQPTSLAWANFNATPGGYPGLAIGTDGFGTYLFENVAAGAGRTLAATPIYSTGTTDRTQSLAWGDWDNDGAPDLALANLGGPVVVYANQDSTVGAPRFAWAWTSTEVLSATGVAWGDATGDGYPELAVSQAGAGNSGYYLNTSVVPTYVTTVFTSPAALARAPLFVDVLRPGQTAPAGQAYAASEIVARPPPVLTAVVVPYTAYG
ncbi:MAG: VCBS repeat-containing protein, partial [Anaerolineales bacterium]|nr:VCBS repeat-containing protein [Anaerolineales bacterium]